MRMEAMTHKVTHEGIWAMGRGRPPFINFRELSERASKKSFTPIKAKIAETPRGRNFKERRPFFRRE